MKKLWLISFGVLLVLLIGVSTAGGSRLAASTEQFLGAEANPISLEQKAANPVEIAEKQESPFLNMVFLQDESAPEATLTVTSGTVTTCGDCKVNQECEWFEAQETLQEGYSLRTGTDGEVTLEFGEEVTLTLYENTQIKIRKYQVLDDGTVQIHIEHLIGKVFFQVNYSNGSSPTVDFKMISPITVFEEADGVKAFSGVSVVYFPKLNELTPEELELRISEEKAFNEGCGTFCDGNNCNNCNAFDALAPVDYTLDDDTGQLLVSYFTDQGYKTMTTNPGERFNYYFQGLKGQGNWVSLCRALQQIANGEQPGNVPGVGPGEPTVGPLGNCGDGVCNIYEKENPGNCPEDCN